MINIVEAAIVGMLMGVVCGIAPLVAALRKGRDGLAIISAVVCAVCGAVGGGLLAIPASLAFLAVILTSGGDKKD